MTAARQARRRWTADELEQLVARYPHEPTAVVAKACGHPLSSVYHRAYALGLRKTATYLDSPAACRLRRGDKVGAGHWFQKGHVPGNKGLRRPGWAPGRMAETQFKKGQYPAQRWDPEVYCIGALRITADGTLQIRLTADPHPRGWFSMARYVWKLHTGRWPRRDQLVRTRNGDPHDTRFDNLELLTRAENMKRNTIHNLPTELKGAIVVLGQLKRRIRERVERTAP